MAINLFPELKTPYFIYAPPWAHESSGIRALHLLCHALNNSGQRAYLVPVNTWFYVNPALDTPILSDDHLAAYDLKGIKPIAVYPEIVQGNPFKLDKVVRWVLAPVGAYGGDKTFPETDKVFGYTKDLAEPVLCLPTFDTTVFYPPPAGSERKGACYYAHKYDKIHGNPLLTELKDATRCVGTPEEVAAILRCSEVCFLYERSEIMVNAELCGCPVLPLVTDYWNGDRPKEFFKEDGTLVPQQELHDTFEWQLRQFVEETQRWR